MASSYRRTRLSPVALAVFTAFVAPQLMAQTAPAAQEQKTEAKKAEEAAQAPAQSVVVSGSRIKRDNYSSAAPVQIIRNEDSALAGFTTTTEVLQGTAVTGGQGQINNAYGGFVTDGGPGANTIGLRGFGPTRSLVLLNGRRLAPSGTRGSVGAADLNTLPSSIVDRIEVLKDGASSIYGSDAVAGVINVITKNKLDGFTADLSMAQPTEGGGAEGKFSLAGGFVSDKGRFLAAYEYSERKSLTLGDRDWTQCNTDYRRTSTAAGVGEWGSFDFVDPLTGKPKCYPISGTGSNGVTINTIGTSTRTGVGAAGSVGTSFNRWRPNPNVTTGLVGYEGVGGGANSLNVRDTFDPRMLNRSLISPTKNHNLYAQGAYDLGVLGDAELYFETLLNRRQSSTTGYRQLSLDYAKGSPLIPADLAFSTVSGPTVITNGANLGVRAFIGFGNDTTSVTSDFGRAVVGMRGSLIKGWEYDVAATSSRSKGTYTFQTFFTDRLARSLDVVASGSGFACKDPSGGCVAAPALTPAVIAGQLPQDWVNYVWGNASGVTKFKEDVVTATATGSLFKMPYGMVKGAVGLEYRRNSIDDTPSEAAQTGNLYNLTSSTPTRGSDSAKDVFAEVEIPLLKNLPAAHELTLNASGRWADYRSYGSGSTYKIGALWSPDKWLTLRATTGTSYRAPALYEQFLGATSGFLSSTVDPCNNWDSPTNAGTTRSNNCKSEGLPAGYTATSSVTVLTTGGAAAGLKAETSKNSTYGVIVQPEMPSGWGTLSLAVDRFDITVDNGVSRAGATGILNRCYDDVGFRASGGFCRLVTRNPVSNALTVSDSYVNLATDIVRGFDYTARYTNNVGVGKLRLNLTATEFTNQSNKLFAEDPLDNVNGTIGAPRWSGAFDARYTLADWTVAYGLEWVGKMSSYDYLGQDPGTSTYKLDVPQYFTHSLSVKYSNPVGKWDATIGVRNLTNTGLPQISAQAGYNRVGNAPLYSGYDYVGRTVFVNISKSF